MSKGAIYMITGAAWFIFGLISSFAAMETAGMVLLGIGLAEWHPDNREAKP